MDRNRIIGNNGTLPWHFSKDLKHFKESTVGQVVLMGRKTFESIGKPLANRVNIIVSRTSKNEETEQLHYVESIETALELSTDRYPNQIIWIIGGSSIYAQALEMDIVDEIYCTEVDGEFDGDTKMLEFVDNYVLQDSVETDDNNKDDNEIYALRFLRYTKKQ